MEFRLDMPREAAHPAIHYNCAPHAGRTGFSFERKHWCRWQTARRVRVTQPPHRQWPIRGSSPALVVEAAEGNAASRRRLARYR
jgi:hypothetical protein